MYVSAHFCRVFAQGWNVRVIQHKRLQQVLPDSFFFFRSGIPVDLPSSRRETSSLFVLLSALSMVSPFRFSHCNEIAE